jgi:hypothetical protein
MSPPDALISASPPQDDPAQDRRARLHEFRMAALQRIAERGLALLDRDWAAPGTEGDPGLTYSRIARAIRQTLMLHARFEDEADKAAEQKQAEAAAARAAEAQRAASAEAGQETHQKRQVKKAVKLAMDLDWDAAAARGEEYDYAELLTDLRERLDDYDDYSDFGRLPVGAVVANICRVMGIAFDPALWQDEPWAVAEMAEKPEGSPYTEWQPETANDDDNDEAEDPEDEDDDPCGLAEEEDRPRRRSRGPP